MTARLFLKLIIGVLCVLIVALAAVDVLVSPLARKTYLEERTLDLAEKAHTIARLSPDGLTALSKEELRRLAHDAGARITVVARDGRVLCDSEADPAHMENHGSRPEISAALKGSEGTSSRRSPTVGVESLYVAVPLREGAIRLAVPLADVAQQIMVLRKEMLMSMVLAFIPAMLVAAVLARVVSSRLGTIIEFAGRLADGGFRKRLGLQGRDELAQLARKLDETAEKLETSFDQLKREHSELERLERVRKDFVINVSHELRTPLASILGYTETLLNGAIYDKEHNLRFLEIIRQNTERLANLASDLLTLSRVELQLQRFQFASYGINRLVRDCVDSLVPLARAKDVRIEVEEAPDRSEVFCDSEAAHQILSNLLDNAIKYTPEGGTVTVSSRALPRAGEEAAFVEVSVRDTGPGIPSGEIPRLFERFYRVDKARSRAMGGTGLGLAIVKHLTRSQGGSVRVESEPGKGSTFAFTLPVDDLRLGEEMESKQQLTYS